MCFVRAQGWRGTLPSGMAALLGASVLNMTLRWTDGAAGAWISGVMGVLYGVSFWLLLLTARRSARS